MYTVTIYTATGLNPVNLPYSPSVITASATETYELPSIDVVQNYFLESITVSGANITGSFWDVVKLADYCKIDNFYYFVTGVKMTSPDVAVLSLVPDFFTSARALGAIKSLGGTTIRYRVPEDEDTFGTYTNNDALLTPMEPLVLVTDEMMFGVNDNLTDKHDDVYIETLVDLSNLQDQFSVTLSEDGSTVTGIAFNGTGVTFTDPTDSDNKITVPFINTASNATRFTTNGIELPLRGTTIYQSDKVNFATALCHSLGIDSGIIKQYEIPENYCGISTSDDGKVNLMNGTTKTDITHLPMTYATVKNKRCLYGQYNSYGIISSSGAKLELLPEQIIGYEGDRPRIKAISDPRPNGAPYFRFEYYNGNNSDESFWINAIRGENWMEHPIKYVGESGNWINYVKFGQSLGASQYRFETGQLDSAIDMFNSSAKSAISDLTTVAGYAGSLAMSSDNFAQLMGSSPTLNLNKESTLTGGKAANFIANVGNTIIDAGHDIYNLRRAKQDYTFAKQNELYNYAFDAGLVAPTIEFVPNNNIVRDLYGNGVIPYRYHYSQNDLKRIDQLLTMYGYSVNKPFFADMLNKHSDFEYIQLSGVQIYGDNLPMWWRQGITDQLNTGMRIWHVKPDNKYYESGLSYEINDTYTESEES